MEKEMNKNAMQQAAIERKRYDRDKARMSVTDIREICNIILDLVENLPSSYNHVNIKEIHRLVAFVIECDVVNIRAIAEKEFMQNDQLEMDWVEIQQEMK